VTEDRFEVLAEAYGGDVSRWPMAERAAAAALMAAKPAFAREVLAQAGRLDAVLDDWARAPAPAALVERILSSAPAVRPKVAWRRWLAPAGLGAGLAAACAAGLLTGVQLSQQITEGDAAVAAVIADLDPTTVSEDV
jgi:hypothetical protein